MSLELCRTLFVLGAMTSMVSTAVAAPPGGPSEQQVARWITELGDGEFAVRENASRRSWLAGRAAEPALEKALQSGDPEVVRRAGAVLEKFRWGIYPDTPAEVVKLIQDYQSMDEENGIDSAIVKQFLDSGIPGLRALLRIANNDKVPKRAQSLRDLVSRQMLGHLQKVFDEVEEKAEWDWFVTLAYEGVCLYGRHFAAYWLLRGRLEDRIRDFRARLEKDSSDKRCASTLAYLYQAGGYFAAARSIVEKEKLDDLLEDVLFKTADWAALAALREPIGLRPIDQASYRFSFARLSGNRKQLETALADLEKLGRRGEAYQAALALLANDRPSDGIRLLTDFGYNRDSAFVVLCDRLQYGEAMALLDQPPAGPDRKVLA